MREAVASKYFKTRKINEDKHETGRLHGKIPRTQLKRGKVRSVLSHSGQLQKLQASLSRQDGEDGLAGEQKQRLQPQVVENTPTGAFINARALRGCSAQPDDRTTLHHLMQTFSARPHLLPSISWVPPSWLEDCQPFSAPISVSIGQAQATCGENQALPKAKCGH